MSENTENTEIKKRGRKKKEITETTIKDETTTPIEEETLIAEEELNTLEEAQTLTHSVNEDKSTGKVYTIDLDNPMSENAAKEFAEKLIEKMSKKPLPEQISALQLSPQAKKWKAYLPMQGITPEKFLEKYPHHPSRQFVEEIIRFEKTMGEKNI